MEVRSMRRKLLVGLAVAALTFAAGAAAVRLLVPRGGTASDSAQTASPAAARTARADAERQVQQRRRQQSPSPSALAGEEDEQPTEREPEPAPESPLEHAENVKLSAESLARLAPERDAVASALTAAMEEYDRAASPKEAAAIMDRFSPLHMKYVSYGGDTRFISFLRRVATEGQSYDARRFAVIAVHRMQARPFVDMLLDLTTSQYPEVRYYAVEGLTWVSGEDRPRATKAMLAALDSTDAKVRTISAIMLGVAVKDASCADALIAHIPGESDERVLGAYVLAVTQLDPENGAQRVRDSVQMSDAPKRQLVAALLAKPAPRLR